MVEGDRHDIGILFVPDMVGGKSRDRMGAFAEALVGWLRLLVDTPADRWAAAGVTRAEVLDWISKQATNPSEELNPESEMTREVMALKDPAHIRLYTFLEPLLQKLPKQNETNVESRPITLRDDLFLAGRVSIDRAVEKSHKQGASIELSIDLLTTNGDNKRSSWVIEECDQPVKLDERDVSKTARWAALVTPAIIAYLLAIPIKSAWEGARVGPVASRIWAVAKMPLGIALALVSVFVSLVMQAYLLCLAIISLIPLEIVRRVVVAQIDNRVAGMAASALALEGDAFQRATVATGLEEAIARLAGRCDHLVIVGRGFGVAAVHSALRSRLPGGLRLVFDIGSTRPLLARLRWLQRPQSMTLMLFLTVASVASAWLACRFLFDESPWRWGYLVAGGLATTLYASAFSAFGSEVADDKTWEWNRVLKRHDVAWIGVYAEYDPLARHESMERSTSTVINNRASLMSDGSTYLANREECIHVLLHEISKLASPDLHSVVAIDEPVMVEARARRKWRVSWLRRGRAVLLWGLVAWAAVRHSELAAIGERVTQLTGGLRSILGKVGLRIETSFLDEYQGWFVGTVVIAASFATLQLVLVLVWRVWDRIDAEVVRRRLSFGAPSYRDTGSLLRNFGVVLYAATLGVLATVVFDSIVLWPECYVRWHAASVRIWVMAAYRRPQAYGSESIHRPSRALTVPIGS